MNDKELYDQLFNNHSSPVKPSKEEAGKDLLSGLFATAAAVQPKKKKKEEDVHEYVKLAEKSNDKTKKSVQKWKEEQTMTPDQIRHKRSFEKMAAQIEHTKKSGPAPIVPPPSSSHSANKTSTTEKKGLYLPRIIDPFEKPNKNPPIKPKPTPSVSTAPPPKKEDKQREDKLKEEREKEEREEQERTERAKKQAKLQKIKRKEIELAAEKEKLEKAVAIITPQPEPKHQRPVRIQQKSEKPQKSQKSQKPQKPQKKKRQSSSSSSSSSGSSSSGSSSKEPDWRAQLRSITKYNPHDQKFRRLDREKIIESNIDRIFGEDKFSSRYGKMEEEEDLRRQMMMKRKQKELKEHRDHRDHRDHREHRDHRDHREHREHKEHKQRKEHKEHKEHREHRESHKSSHGHKSRH